MTKRNTKEMILDAALRLFSDKGYDGVGVREIAGEVGIRESALYKHFQNKQDIFDSIIAKMEAQYEQEMQSFQMSEQIVSTVQGGEVQESLYKMCFLMFRIYLQDERGAQLRRMLTIEQAKNTVAGQKFSGKLIDAALAYIAKAFSEMIEQGYYREVDPHVMALQFYAPLYLLMVKYDRQPERHDEALSFLEKHIEQFDLLYRI